MVEVERVNMTLLDKLHNDDCEIRIEAVHEIRDQRLLFEVIMKDTNYNVRETAYSMLYDQELIAYVIVENSNVRYWQGKDILGHNAVEKLTDQRWLTYVAKTSPNVYVRFEAVERLTDRFILQEIANNDDEPNVRYLAQLKLNK